MEIPSRSEYQLVRSCRWSCEFGYVPLPQCSARSSRFPVHLGQNFPYLKVSPLILVVSLTPTIIYTFTYIAYWSHRLFLRRFVVYS